MSDNENDRNVGDDEKPGFEKHSGDGAGKSKGYVLKLM